MGIHASGNVSAQSFVHLKCRMLESLPERVQEQVLEHVREYIEDLRNEEVWSESFSRTRGRVAAAARQARKEIGEGKAGDRSRKTGGGNLSREAAKARRGFKRFRLPDSIQRLGSGKDDAQGLRWNDNTGRHDEVCVCGQ